MKKLKENKGMTLKAVAIIVIILLIVGGIITNLKIGQGSILAKDETTDTPGELVEKVEIGDYVAYDPTLGVTDTSKLIYTSPVGTGEVHGNGKKEQTFTVGKDTKWRVLSKDKVSGEVVLISNIPIESDTKEGFQMSGGVGYLYAEQELNEICRMYGYGNGANTTKIFTYQIGDVVEGEETKTITGSGARSINVEDINQITQYDKTAYIEELGDNTYPYGESYTHEIYYPSKTSRVGASELRKAREDIRTYYSYECLLETQSLTYKMLFGENSDMRYWLASRAVSSFPIYAMFDVFRVNDGFIDTEHICGGDHISFIEYNSIWSLPIRPIVYLTPNIQTLGRDKTGAWIISE